jgi:hypothetical protein
MVADFCGLFVYLLNLIFETNYLGFYSPTRDFSDEYY